MTESWKSMGLFQYHDTIHNILYSIEYENGYWWVKFPICYRDSQTHYGWRGFDSIEGVLEWLKLDSHHHQGLIDYADEVCGGSINLAKEDLYGEEEEEKDEGDNE